MASLKEWKSWTLIKLLQTRSCCPERLATSVCDNKVHTSRHTYRLRHVTARSTKHSMVTRLRSSSTLRTQALSLECGKRGSILRRPCSENQERLYLSMRLPEGTLTFSRRGHVPPTISHRHQPRSAALGFHESTRPISAHVLLKSSSNIHHRIPKFFKAPCYKSTKCSTTACTSATTLKSPSSVQVLPALMTQKCSHSSTKSWASIKSHR